MKLIKDALNAAPVGETLPHGIPARDRTLARLLLGRAEGVEIPAATEIAAAVTALATGSKRRVVLPLASTPAEIALERRGANVYVSLHSTTATPEIVVRERAVSMVDLLEECARSVERSSDELVGGQRELALRIASRTRTTSIVEADADETLVVRGGCLESPRRAAPIAFGFEATFRGATRGTTRGVRADVHALLFEGTLVAFVHGRRLVLARGPIALPLLRMLAAARAYDEARSSRRPPHIRMRIGSFAIALRGDPSGSIDLTLEGERGVSATASGLDVAEALLPIARVASELVREFVAFDRTQGRNLRVRSIREDVRAIRRIRSPREERSSFVNHDADRMRAMGANTVESSRSAETTRTMSASLRYGERWRIALDGLDAASTFLCGDRLVVASSHHTVALSRDDGSVLWARDADGAACAMAGDVLLRALENGTVELCSVVDGEPFAEARLGHRVDAPMEVHSVGDASTPPVAVLRESRSKLAAIDLRTGELLWRFGVRKSDSLVVAKLGRMLFVGHEDTIHGIDVVTGEELFRHVDEGLSISALATTRDRVACVFDRPTPTLVVLDAFRGEALGRHALAGSPRGKVVANEDSVLLPLSHGDTVTLARFDVLTGELVFAVPDPGLGRNAESIVVDDRVVLNDVEGRVHALDLRDGSVVWTSRIARPIDDVPRIRKPLLRAGVLFVPGAEVSVLRPFDGTAATASFPCDLIPDRLLVDERTWVYVAEESGHLAGYAPAMSLRLIRGGA